MSSEPNWLAAAQQFQQQLVDQWTKIAQGTAQLPDLAQNPLMAAMNAAGPGAASGWGLPQGAADLFKGANGQPLSFDMGKLMEIQRSYLGEVAELWNQSLTAKPIADRRFSSEAWSKNPVSAFSAAAYLLNARTLMAMAEAVQGDAKTRSRVRFSVQQWIDASSPSNFLAFNAEAQKKAHEATEEAARKADPEVAPILEKIRKAMEKRQPNQNGRQPEAQPRGDEGNRQPNSEPGRFREGDRQPEGQPRGEAPRQREGNREQPNNRIGQLPGLTPDEQQRVREALAKANAEPTVREAREAAAAAQRKALPSKPQTKLEALVPRE